MRITAVSYLNTKPFIYGLFRSDLAGTFDLSLDIPSVCAQKLLSGEADIALAPVAIIPELPQAHVISNYCIGSTGAVKTVCIFSEKPLQEIKYLYLDFHSRSSVALTRILCEKYWKISPEFIGATPGFESKIKGHTAALIIGDRAMGQSQYYPFTYDLGAEWTAWTGLPFVFAAWISTKPINSEWLLRFNAALQHGLDLLPELTKILPVIPDFDIDAYYRDHISYQLDAAKWQALHLFLSYLAGENGYHMVRDSKFEPPDIRL